VTYNAGKHIPEPKHMKCGKCKGEADAKSFSTQLNCPMCRNCLGNFALWCERKRKTGKAFFATDFLKRGEK